MADAKDEEHVEIVFGQGEESGEEDDSSEASDNLIIQGINVGDAEEMAGDVGLVAVAGDVGQVAVAGDVEQMAVAAGVEQVAVVGDDEDLEELERKAENKWKTTKIIEKKALMGYYLILKKRIQTLSVSIALNNMGGGTCSQGQMDHWERELLSCKRKVANIEQNNF